MLINEKNYLGLNLKPYARQITENWLSLNKDVWTEEENKQREEVIKSFFGVNTKPYLITKKAIKDIELIKLGDKFDFTLLMGIKDQITTYLINNLLCFRFYIDGDNLRVLIIRRTPLESGEVWLDYAVCYCHLPTGKLSQIDPVFKKEFNFFLKCLIFVEIADSELVYINSAQKIGTKKEGFYNLTPSQVVIVNSNWNKIVVRTDGFSVSGHFRLQRVGEGRKEVKLVWVEPYMKSGYIKQQGA